MELDVNVQLEYQLSGPTDLLLQIEVADLADQRLQSSNIEISDTEHLARVAADDGLGERIWIRTDGIFRCDYTARVVVDRPALDISTLDAVAPHLLPGDTVRYLMPSRYCPSDEFQSFVEAEFGAYQGGARIAAMRDWITKAFSYVPGSSNGQTTALDSFVQRQGVCRDYAHVMIALARASTIPARFASVYAPGVTPPDFHAVAEVFLDGTWHLVDATGMATADTIARIGVGPDASGVAFLTTFGPCTLRQQSVSVTA
ncbi:transglutaminase-like domain-containing protein [Gymnodinialimonas ceratoperidinii]|uniref:Transglutaminase family protein n=1 Tax=Gymnodinialimonas ceratoperidinii TaxID=2856823 RepID=A0A8F6YDE4_9RHOB|nr:transglutaminase family protein [Gymnodinialimonas ceratoperidinii]QXT40102.1 transglutaminase family protein [Gymnodinialimonas ceratoperidinii]